MPAQRFRPTPLGFALAIALGGLPALNAGAQEDPRHDDAIADLTGIVVRANPLARTAEDLARPVAVLAGEALDEAKAASLGETVSRLPGVQSSFFGAGVGRPVIRGLEGARVQVLSDGLSAGDVSTVSADHAVSTEPFLANQIEVLKGPATLLYGSGAIGGAVNVIDGRIPETVTSTPLEGRAELRAGSVNDERTGMLRLDGSSASGRLAFHVDALHRETGDYDIPGFAERAGLHDDHGDGHDGEAGHDVGDAVRGHLPNSSVRTDSGALGVSYIGDAGFLGIGHSLFNTRYGVPGHSHSAPDDDDGHGHGEPGSEGAVHIVMDQRRNEVRGGLDDIGAFESLRIKLAHTDYTHTEYEGDTVGTVFDNTTLEGRVELVHRAIAGWQGAVGLQLSERDFSAVGDEAFVPDSNARDAGLFWIGERDFGAFGVELGLRHDRNRIDVAAVDAIGPSRDFDANSASLAMRWDVSPDLHLSFGLDRAQRTATAEELYSSGMHVATQSFEFGNPDLDPETANRGEIGLHWHRGPLRLGASLFQVRYDDFIYLADTGLEDSGLALRAWHQGDARFHGGEVEAQWDFAETAHGAWSLKSFADVVRGRLDGGASRRFDASIPHGDHVHDYTAELVPEGNLPRIAPRRLGSELRWQGAQWRASLGAVRYARQDHVARFETTSPGYTLVHASVAWHRDGANGNAMEVFVDGRNLLDEEARVHTSVLKDLAPMAGRGVSAGVRVFF